MIYLPTPDKSCVPNSKKWPVLAVRCFMPAGFCCCNLAPPPPHRRRMRRLVGCDELAVERVAPATSTWSAKGTGETNHTWPRLCLKDPPRRAQLGGETETSPRRLLPITKCR